MEITAKQEYDLNNRNIASQNVQLGTIIKNEGGNALTTKQIYDLDNDNIVTQEVELGKIINAICTDTTSTIEDLTEEQIDRLNNMDVACQNCQFGTLLQQILDGTQKFTVTLNVNDETMGTVTGAGRYVEGASVTITAAYNAGYTFVNWTQNGEVVSTNATYTFTMPASAVTYVANFEALSAAYLNVGGAAYLLNQAGETPSVFTSVRFTNNNSYIEGATEICSMSDIADNSIMAYKNGTDLIIYSPVTIKVSAGGFALTQLTGVTQVYFDNFNTDEMTNAAGMFLGCESLETLELGNLTTANITNTRSMFEGCSSLTRIYVSDQNADWTQYNVTDSTDMFEGCALLPNFDAEHVDITMAKLDSDGGYFSLVV